MSLEETVFGEEIANKYKKTSSKEQISQGIQQIVQMGMMSSMQGSVEGATRNTEKMADTVKQDTNRNLEADRKDVSAQRESLVREQINTDVKLEDLQNQIDDVDFGL